MAKKEETKKSWYERRWFKVPAFVMIGLVGFVMLGAVVDTIESVVKDIQPEPVTQEKKPEPKGEPNYKIKIVGNSYADPTSRRVTFTVTNTGKAAGSPACTVDVSNESGAYNGYEYITWDTPLEPGERKYFEGLIIITNEGAAYATHAEVSCI